MRENLGFYKYSSADLIAAVMVEIGAFLILTASSYHYAGGAFSRYLFPMGLPICLCLMVFFFKKPESALLVMIAFIPFEGLRTLSSSHSSFTISKVLGGFLIVIVMLSYASKQGKRSLLESRQDKIILLFILSLFICLIPSIDKRLSFDTVRKYMTGMAVYFLITYFFRSPRYLKVFLMTMVSSITLAAFVANVGYLFKIKGMTIAISPIISNVRTVGNAVDPNYFAALILMSIPFCFNYFLSEKHQRYKRLFLIALLNNIYTIMLTFSRSGLVVLIATILFLIIQNSHDLKEKLNFNTLFPTTFSIVVVLGLLSFLSPPKYESRISSMVTPTDSSLLRRGSYLAVGFNVFTQNPVFGIGPGNYSIAYANSGYGKLFAGDSFRSRYRQAHNTYIEIISGCGILGIPFFMLLFETWKENGRLNRYVKFHSDNPLAPMVKSVHASFFGLLISALFLSLDTYKYFWLLIAATVILKKLIPRNEP